MRDATKKMRILYQFDEATPDDKVLKYMKKPRCGNKDLTKKIKKKLRFRRYDLNPAWTTNSFKYAIEKYSSRLSEQQQDNIAAQAFQLWKDSVPELEFASSSASETEEAHIKIRWV